MPYLFKSSIYKEGKRSYIAIPFNVGETCKRKGSIPVKVMIDGYGYECKLIAKGEGNYVIPVTVEVLKQIDEHEAYDVAFSCLQQISRNVLKNPFTKENLT